MPTNQMDTIRVNARVLVNNAAIRREVVNGREHIVVPSWTLPDDIVMNGGLYEAAEIAASYKGLENTLAPLGHPMVDGKEVEARHPLAINAYHVGAFNRNVSRKGGRVYVEKWIDVATAEQSDGGRSLLAAIEKNEPIHTSTGIFVKRELAVNGDGFNWKAREMVMDHDAILIGERGAATPDEGVGMLIGNSEQVLVFNSEVPAFNAAIKLMSDSYGNRRKLLDAAVKEIYATANEYAYVEDFDDSSVVFTTGKGIWSVSYELDDGNPILGADLKEVVIESTYVVRDNSSLTANTLQKNAVKSNPEPVKTPPSEAKKMDETQVKELIANAVSPLTEQISGLKTENTALKALLEASVTASEADDRAIVTEKHGELVANQLKGEALRALALNCRTAAPLTGAGKKLETNGQKSDAGDLSDYLPGAAK